MKPFRLITIFILIALLLPTLAVAEQTPAPSPEETPEPSPTPLFGSGLAYEDTQRDAREQAHQRILRAAGARGIYVADASDLSLCYFSRNEHEQFPPGSTTKIMTALLTIENIPLDDVAAAPREATRLGGTNTMLGLFTGEEMRVEDLLYGLMLVSGNDCAITLAFHLDGSEEAFAERMNARAASLGMLDTDFTNPCGRNVGKNLSSPYDMALLTQEALKNPQFCTIVGTATYTIPTNAMRTRPKEITNSNRLVSDRVGKGYHYPDAIGVKTGATALGTCLVTAAKREDVTIICVQLGMKGEDNEAKRQELFRRSVQIFDYVFDYEYAHVPAETLVKDYAESVFAEGASPDDPEGGMLTVRADPTGAAAFRPIREIDLLASGDAAFSVTSEVRASAPVKQGDPVGIATFSYNGRDWFTLPLIAARDVEPPPTPAPTTPIPIDEDTLPETTPTATLSPTPAPTAAPTPVPAEPEPARRFRPLWIILPAAALGTAAILIVRSLCRRKRRS